MTGTRAVLLRPFRRVFDTARRHPWPTAATAFVAVAGLAGGLLVGLGPHWIALLVTLIAGGALALLARRSRSTTGDRLTHSDPDDPSGGRSGGPSLGMVTAHFGFVAIVVFAGVQVVPYGRAHSNPPITGEPEWASERTRELMVNACYGCHSNQVDWPWYASVAPLSWAVTDHVNQGRDAVNYSEFATDRGDAEETIEVILEGSMPPAYYTRFGLHPEADLTDAEIAELIEGLRNTPGMSEHDDRDGDDD